MTDIDLLTVSGWLLLGVTVGLGPCMSHQMIILLSYIGMTENRVRASVIDFASYSLARVTAYTVIGLISGVIGQVFYRFVTQPVFIKIAAIGLGAFLIVLALLVLFIDANSLMCRIGRQCLIARSGRAMALAGFLTALTPCPAKIGLIAYASGSGHILFAGLIGLALGIGTTLSPLLIAAPAFGFIKQKLAQKPAIKLLQTASAFILFAYGLHLLIASIL